MKLTQNDIGGEIISIITRGMYADPKDALREYVQNAIDAGTENISISIQQNNIVVQDWGHGMDKVVMRKAIRVGMSDKDPTNSVGFMGIGLYSSFHLCDSLLIISKVKNASPNRLEFNFKVMREMLEDQKKLRLQAHNNIEQIALLTLLESNIEFTELENDEYPETGTWVELSGLDPDFFMSLSKFKEVSDYLERVIPLPFDPEFSYGDSIQEYIQQICNEKSIPPYKIINLNLKIGNEDKALFRPYKDSDFRPKPIYPKFEKLEDSSNFFGIAWGCLNNNREVIQKEDVRGFIIRKQGFAIGNRQLLADSFSSTFFNRYVGEFIVLNSELLPNGSRSDFEYSDLRNKFYRIVSLTSNEFIDFANEHQEKSRAEEDLGKAISQFREYKSQLGMVENNTNKLLDFYRDLNKTRDSFKRKTLMKDKTFNWRISDELKETAQIAMDNLDSLINEITELIETKSKKHKTRLKTRSAIAKDLDNLQKPLSLEDNEPKPNSLVELIGLFGLSISNELKLILNVVDDRFIHLSVKNTSDYNKVLLQLKNDIEDMLTEQSE